MVGDKWHSLNGGDKYGSVFYLKTGGPCFSNNPSKLSKEYNVNASTISTIFSSKAKILEHYEKNLAGPEKKRVFANCDLLSVNSNFSQSPELRARVKCDTLYTEKNSVWLS
ncbi:hypothetical protein BpHYR1_030917 [Brachionus plicatilis]|uniref:HTH psq-type domain-containing protein n=1 Tax=Brachionus plicatilis TaxID=10195 RepID=A0A3M7SBD2_BRAPC|nr:hypothetical protein BpHYR1_030917 [Brachionus plicatilis]